MKPPTNNMHLYNKREWNDFKEKYKKDYSLSVLWDIYKNGMSNYKKATFEFIYRLCKIAEYDEFLAKIELQMMMNIFQNLKIIEEILCENGVLIK